MHCDPFYIIVMLLSQTLMEKRIRPWINKKIVEYIGEEEATLVDFVCSKVKLNICVKYECRIFFCL